MGEKMKMKHDRVFRVYFWKPPTSKRLCFMVELVHARRKK
jgi:hypothetical protein